MDTHDGIGRNGEDLCQLFEDARDAIGRLIEAAPFGTAASLNEIYQRFDGALNRTRAARARAQDPELLARRRQSAAREAECRREDAEWRATARADRERLVLDAVGDDSLTLGEISARIYGGWRDRHSRVRYLALALVASGELTRTAETFQNKTRYRYARRTELSGPIADLDRMLADDGEAA